MIDTIVILVGFACIALFLSILMGSLVFSILSFYSDLIKKKAIDKLIETIKEVQGDV